MSHLALRIRAVAAALAVALVACGDDPAPMRTQEGTNLLARKPDARIEDTGRVVADASHGLGEHGLDGWTTRDRTADGRAFVWCDQPRAQLRVFAPEPATRTLRVVALVPRDPEDPTVQATLVVNGFAVDRPLELTPEPRESVFEIDELVWRRGENAVEIVVERMVQDEQGEWRGVGLVELSWGEPRTLRLDPRTAQATLPSGTGLVHRLELLAPSTLLVRGTAAAAGRIEVALATIDAETGKRDVEERVPLPVAVKQGSFDRELPLPPPSDRVLEVELSWIADGGKGALDLAGLVVAEKAPAQRPPIVFVSIDTLAARNMSLYGYERPTTPNLVEFAREAVVFERARANAPFTLQSYMSQFSGLYPTANRIEFAMQEGRRPSPWEIDQLAPNRWTMAELLRASGYRTAAWVDNPWLARGFGFDQGFEHYDTSAAEIEIWRPRGGIEHNAELLEEWIDELAPGEPFFAFLQAQDPHGPYHPGAPFDERFHGDEHYDAESTARVGKHQLHAFGVIPDYIARGISPEGNFPERLPTADLIASYDEEVLQTDARIGELFDFLRERGLFDEAVIVVSADHGESMLDHAFYFDHGTLWDEVLHVPLAIRLPGGAHGGKRVTQSVQLVDLYPTLADVVGVEPRGYLHGRSLLPLIEGADARAVPTLSEGGIMDQAAVVQEGWKLIEYRLRHASLQTMVSHPRLPGELLARVAPELVGALLSKQELDAYFQEHLDALNEISHALRGPFYELYHVAEDPLELVDLAEKRPDKIEELLPTLAALRKRGVEAREHASVVPPKQLAPHEREQLEAMGYVDRSDDGSDG